MAQVGRDHADGQVWISEALMVQGYVFKQVVDTPSRTLTVNFGGMNFGGALGGAAR